MYGEKVKSRRIAAGEHGERRRKFLRALAFAVFFLLAAGLVSLLLVLTKPFSLKKIVFPDEAPELAEEVAPFLEEYLGQSGIRLAAEENLPGNLPGFLRGRLPSVEQELVVSFPKYRNFRVRVSGHRLSVEGEAREAFLVFYDAGGVVVADREGTAVLSCDVSSAKTECRERLDYDCEEGPTVTGLGIFDAQIGRKIQYSDGISWEKIIQLYYGIFSEETLSQSVRTISFSGTAVYLSLNGNVLVDFGDVRDEELLFSRLERLSAILRSGQVPLKDGTLTLSEKWGDVWHPNEEKKRETE